MRDVVVLGGARTPNQKFDSLFRDLPAYHLGRVALQEALFRSELRPERLDEVVFGCVGNPVEAANVARVTALLAGVPERVPAFTVSRNCASGLQAVEEGWLRIATGRASFVAAGGVESMSRAPLLFKESARAKFTALTRAKSLAARFVGMARFRPADFAPVPALLKGLTDFNTRLNMGETAELLAREFGLTREEQDRYALLSHLRAAAARGCGRLKREIVPVPLPPRYDTWAQEDNGIRENQTLEALAKLRPVFDHRRGTVTAGNSSQLTDGASCLILADEERARAEGLPVLGRVKAFAAVGLDPARMGLGPAFAVPALLRAAGMGLKDVDLFEINEAFAAQVLACERALESARWCAEHLGLPGAHGAWDREKTNVNGGAIALGHPVGQSGNRLVLTLLHELKERGAAAGVASLCIGGGQGQAVLLERA